MPRYFIAVPLPDGARDRLVAVQPPAIPGVRLIGREEMHLTLHFLGELPPQSVALVQAALRELKVDTFTIMIDGLGQFPEAGQPTVLWSRVHSSRLMALHESVGSVLTSTIGFQPEERPYSPHITLARVNDVASSDGIENYLEKNMELHIPSIVIGRFALYSSQFVDNIPRYREEALFHLL